MTRLSRLGRALLAAGLAGAAVIGLASDAFVRKWEPVPSGLPGFAAVAWASNLLLLGCAVGLLVPAAAPTAASMLVVLMWAWIILLHLPLVAIHPTALLPWGYLSGVLTVSAGALALWPQLRSRPELRALPAALRHNAPKTARLIMGPALVVFGISHLLFAPAMVALVPAGLPFKTQIIDVTGVAHIAAGLALISGVVPRLAAILEAAMMSSFVLLADLPRYAGGLVQGPPWALAFETAMSGAVWCVAGSLTAATLRPD